MIVRKDAPAWLWCTMRLAGLALRWGRGMDIAGEVERQPAGAGSTRFVEMEDRDMLAWPALQDLFRRIASEGAVLGTFRDRHGRVFDVVAGERPLEPPDDDADRAALALGYDTVLLFGAMARGDGRCYASLGLYAAPGLPTVREKSLEVDRNHRRRRIGAGLFSVAVRAVAEQHGKALDLSRAFTAAGERFATWAARQGMM